MRVNTRVFTERGNLFGEFSIPNCPSQFKVIAENILNMITAPGYSVGSYHNMTELDKILMLDYWKEFDQPASFDRKSDFYFWFIHKATAPELIRRARQWLSEHNYIIIDQNVLDRAYSASDNFSRAVKR